MKRLILTLLACAVALTTTSPALAYNFIDPCGATWNQSPSPYYINQNGYSGMSESQVHQIIQSSWAIWSAPCCSDWSVSYLGETSNTALSQSSQNVISFQESNWPSAFGDVDSTIAVTTPSIWSDCSIRNADMIYNAVGFQFINGAPAFSGQADLMSITVHEQGHWLGLDHSGINGSSMFWAYSGGTNERTLHQDDEDGVCALYPGSCAIPTCASNNDCQSPLICDLGAGQCVAPDCSVDADCGPGFICNQGDCVASGGGCRVCQTCAVNADCGANGFCAEFTSGDRYCTQSCPNGNCPGDSQCFQVSNGNENFPLCFNPSFASGDLCPGSYTCSEAPGEAWCQSCDATSPCPNGWSCFSWSAAPSVTFCSPTCNNNADCRSDHFCDPSSDCVPNRSNTCYNGDVWEFDVCGNAIVEVQACSTTETCSGNACVSSCTNVCAQGSRRCAGGGFEECTTGANGCTAWGPTQSCPGSSVCANDGTCVTTGTAWCETCNGPSDCPTGWSCYTWSGASNNWCSKPCSSDADCRSDHTCSGTRCVPDQTTGCYNEDVWTIDACNNPVAIQTDCPQTCQAAACVSTCSDQCSLGATQCNASGQVETCNTASNGCTDWSDAQTCAAGSQCANGECITGCVDACTPGLRACADAFDVDICRLDPATECMTWQPFTTCGEGMICEGDGACVVGCADVCTPGLRRCAADASSVEICRTPEGGECNSWQPFTTCGEGLICEGDGTCVAGCVDECAPDSRRCADATQVEICRVPDGGECTSWQPFTVCGAGLSCMDGGVCLTSDADPDPGADATSDAGPGVDTASETDTNAPVVSRGASEDCACRVRRETPADAPWSPAAGLLLGLVWVGLRRRQ